MSQIINSQASNIAKNSQGPNFTKSPEPISNYDIPKSSLSDQTYPFTQKEQKTTDKMASVVVVPAYVHVPKCWQMKMF